MAFGILAGDPLSRNDLNIMVQIFEQSFEHHLHHNTPCRSEYLQSVRTLIGLGFTAVLADKNLLHLYEPLLTDFLIAQQDDFKWHLRTNKSIAQSVVQMIHIATVCFYILKFPRYYQDFITALSCIFKTAGFGKQEVERILEFLMVT